MPDARQDGVPEDQLDDVLGNLRFDERGLVAAVVQQWDTREVLMLAWMDVAALRETLLTGEATYYSRGRGGRWRKGETSGHTQRVLRIGIDCDGDAVLLSVEQQGAACHTGTRSCFETASVELDPG